MIRDTSASALRLDLHCSRLSAHKQRLDAQIAELRAVPRKRHSFRHAVTTAIAFLAVIVGLHHGGR